MVAKLQIVPGGISLSVVRTKCIPFNSIFPPKHFCSKVLIDPLEMICRKKKREKEKDKPSALESRTRILKRSLHSNSHSKHCLQSENDNEQRFILTYINDTLKKRHVQIASCFPPHTLLLLAC